MKMFDDIGGKIKKLASVIAKFGIISCIITGIIIICISIAQSFKLFLIGIGVATIGPLVSWINSWMLYAFGTLVENSQIIADSLSVSIHESSGKHSKH